MSSEFSPELRRELLDDFYAECDELLTAMREALGLLASVEKGGAQETKLVENLFRGTHSIKGNSAIIGLRVAEELAHRMEDLLRAVSKHQVAITDEVIDGLLLGTQRLEKIVVAHRLKKKLPEIADLLARFQSSLPATTATRIPPIESSPSAPSLPVGAPATDPVAAARSKGLIIYQASFAPSPELDQRGVNVSSVRQRLGGIGEILSATPHVRGKGSIVFEFMVGLKEVPADLGFWSSDGIQFKPAAPAVAAAPVASGDAAEEISLTPSHIVRVDLARLDDLMRIVGEMVIHRSRLEERIQQLPGENSGLKEVNLAFNRSLREMREAVTRVRMVPIGELFARMPFVVRDLARDSGKKAKISLMGNQTEVDKFLVERLKEPLLHLVRNAFAHGIEPPAERVAAGKPAEALITLQAASAGDFVVITIRDDGRGVDAAAVTRRAKALAVEVPVQSGTDNVLAILCSPGFSTREEADRASGRGVGMAVVANTIRELGGTLTLETTLGQGTAFTLKVPLSVSIADAITVGIGGQVCAVLQSAVDEIIQMPADEARSINQNEVIPYRDGLLPLVRLASLFGGGKLSSPQLTVLVVSSERGAVGLVVERVYSQREIVVRPLADPLLRVRGISGATELGDGRPILILDPQALTEGVTRPPQDASFALPPSTARAS